MQLELKRDRQGPLPEERLRPDRQMADTVPLYSERLVLRAPEATDVDAIAHLANNWKVASMLSRMPHPYTVKDAADFVQRANTGEMGKCVYAITRLSDDALLGCCGITEFSDGVVELGYWIGERYWNNGYVTEAAQVLIDETFLGGSYSHINASCRVTNPGSRRVLQKCGFQFHGTGMVPCRAENAMMPVELYRLDRKTWTSLRHWGGRI